jgi:GNAT superfamily N-acetyltransferase
MLGVRIREAKPEEADMLFKVQRASALAGFAHIFPPDDYPFPDEAELSTWMKLLKTPDVAILVAERAGRPGGVAVIGHEELLRFFLVPEWWGSGVADVLHEAALDTLRQRGDSICRLWVLEANHRARRFYERRGWRLDGRKRVSIFPPFPPAVGYSRGVDVSVGTKREE